MRLWRRSLVVLALVTASMLVTVSAAVAATFDVDTTTDSAAAGLQACTAAANDCSLRGAIIKANSQVGSHTIRVPAGTFTLTIGGAGEDNASTGDLDIRQALTISGAGANATIVQAGNAPGDGVDRVFDVIDNSGRGALWLADVTVRHGNDGGQGGGGIRADGPLTLERVHLDKNRSPFAGGGLAVLSTTATIRDSTISENEAQSGSGGGGISALSGSAVLTIENTTIVGNVASPPSAGGGGIAHGGAATTTLNNVTIAQNSANSGGGVNRPIGSMTIRNSILANNTATIVGAANCNGAIVSQGSNLLFGSNGSCPFNAGLGDLINTGDPLLGALANNGGPTPTMALEAGSPAIDAGNAGTPGSGGATCAAGDQRGVARPEDGNAAGGARCDIGAVEVTAADALFVDRFDDTAAASACTATANDCSLRGAVLAANVSGGRIIVPAGIHTLSVAGQNEDAAATGDLDILKTVTITGAGASVSTIQAGANSTVGIDRVFDVQSNGGQGNLTLRTLRVRHGRSNTAGGITATGALTLDRVEIVDNQGTSIGGVNAEASASIQASLIARNRSTTGVAGGIRFGSNATASLTNVTIAENRADSSNGGGLSSSGTTTLNNVTIAGNSAQRGGGVIAPAGTLTVRNSIVANNTAPQGNPNCFSVAALTSSGNNLVFGGDACNFTGSGDIQQQNPQLGPLQANGGATPTMALGVGSAAVDAGNNTAPGGGGNACASTDQRGVGRTFDGNGDGSARCDIGAFEVITLVVDRTDDVAGATACTGAANDCSLRGAVIAASNSVLAQRILLPNGTYRLTITGANEDAAATGDLDILNAVDIVGAGAGTTIIEAGASPGAGIDRVFHVLANGGAGGLGLSDLTVRHGNESNGGGGAILAFAPLTMSRVHITANQTGFAGGGLFLAANTVIRDSTVSLNQSAAATGGGGILIGSGGITVSLENVTIANNTAAGTGLGGGIAQVSNATTSLNNVTIAGNTANNGGGIVSTVGTMTNANTIIAGNTSAGGAANCAGSVTSLGNNLVTGGVSTCSFTASGDLLGAFDPRLGPLQDNGGPTPTMALGVGSAAIDAGNAGTPGTGSPTCAATDQRGTARPQDGDGLNGARCDIGAFEAPQTVGCLPRPPVVVGIVPNGQGGFNVTVTRGVGSLTELRFHGAPSAQVPTPNALVDIPGQPPGQSGEITFTPPAGTVTQTFTVRPANGVLPTTLPIDVIDGCGLWPTFVGAGTAASTGGVGTFVVTPSTTTPAVGETLTLTFLWVVPTPEVWRSLSSMELRLTDSTGVVWGVRWQEQGDTFTVTDNRAPTAFALGTAQTQGSGPTGPAVTLTLPIQLLDGAAGRTFTVEVRATDDINRTQPFAPATAFSVPAVGVPSDGNPDKSVRLSEQERFQRDRSNAGSREDEEIEGNVLEVNCAGSPPSITLANRDGDVLVELRGDAAGACRSIKPGDYAGARGEKVHEQYFIADDLDTD